MKWNVKRVKHIIAAVSVGLVISVFAASVGGFAAECRQIRDQVLRLHIIANSDIAEDQEVKLLVRDAVLDSSAGVFASSDNKAQAQAEITGKLDEIAMVAKRVLNENGFNYEAKATLVNMYFETRSYDGMTLPAGYYDAVRIELGAAKGKNWWCMLYPGFCLPAACKTPDVEDAFGKEGAKIVTANPKYEVRFAIVEWITKIF